MELGYARVSTVKQDLDRQIDALIAAGVAPERIYLTRSLGRRSTVPGCASWLGTRETAT